ncbi:MAG TPA: GntR family transcriptional regulator [Tessaracoccus flavescens]|uniref:GntR family transcriptional regulator n=1 Tax=Tessaracoccus flavescens TaxID=399497 RepID=A0A921JR50_9ACTN|nr:GntR family transcriptional regulator [Tessaracoccus flavescens]
MEFDPSIPIWLQLVDEFTRRIVTGRWRAGERIAGVRDLAAELRVNPNTVQRTLAELERRGLCRAERATGRFVTDDQTVIDDARTELAAEAATDYARRAQGLGMSLTAARDLLGRQWPAASEGGHP